LLTDADVLSALKQIEDPDLHRDIVSLGFIKNLSIQNGNVSLDINLTTPACPVKDQMQAQAKKVIESLPGVKQVDVRKPAQVHQQYEGSNAERKYRAMSWPAERGSDPGSLRGTHR
jgi:ATP-binding protein involved in chromosome partitioning